MYIRYIRKQIDSARYSISLTIELPTAGSCMSSEWKIKAEAGRLSAARELHIILSDIIIDP